MRSMLSKPLRFVSIPLFWILAGLLLVAPAFAAPPPRLKLLFVGDNGHHQPAVRFKQLQPVLKKRRIDMTYTDVVEDLNPQTLKDYDGVVLYANIDTIAPDPARSLLDFVAAGHGFIPL